MPVKAFVSFAIALLTFLVIFLFLFTPHLLGVISWGKILRTSPSRHRTRVASAATFWAHIAFRACAWILLHSRRFPLTATCERAGHRHLKPPEYVGHPRARLTPLPIRLDECPLDRKAAASSCARRGPCCERDGVRLCLPRRQSARWAERDHVCPSRRRR